MGLNKDQVFKLYRHTGSVVVRTFCVCVIQKSVEIHSLSLSQCRELRIGEIWGDPLATTTAQAREYCIYWR